MSGFRLTSSSHNVNLWIVPLKMSLAAVALFAITITPDMLAANHVIHLPDWFTMGGIDDARAILSAMLGCVSTVLALIFSVGTPGIVDGGQSVWPAPAVSLCPRLGDTSLHWPLYGGVHLCVPGLPGHPQG